MKKAISILILALLTTISCKKEAGEGGKSIINGKIWQEEWNSTFTFHDSATDHFGADVDVYIVYGNDAIYGSKVKTSPTGVFEFKYLRPGTYSIYVYSKDSSPGGKVAIQVAAEITKKKQTVDIGTLTIKN